MPRQRCPNCQSDHDVSIFVTGQRVRCDRCGVKFEVHRDDVSGAEHTVAPSSLRDLGGPGGLLGGQGGGDGSSGQGGAGAGSGGQGGADGNAAVALTPDAEPDATTISKGLVVPGYQVINVVGRGGMGEVYLARQISLGRKVAIKVLAPHLASDPSFVARFEKESAALAALSNPNIVNIIDRGRVDDTVYFVMEYVEGRSLRELLAAGPLIATDAVKIIAQICRAIDYAHSKGVIHRDLKPENILVDTRGHVKVADFGLAGMVGADDRMHMTRTDVAMGTFNYMAPEQRRDARSVDGRADLYSLGVMLYELLTGDLPVGRFRLPSERLEGLDARFDDIVCRALESDPAERYQRASAVGEDLEALISGASLSVPPATAPDWSGAGARGGTASGAQGQTASGPQGSGGRAGGESGRGEHVASAFGAVARGAGSVVETAGRGVYALAKIFLGGIALIVFIVAVVIVSIALVSKDGCEGPALRIDDEGITVGNAEGSSGIVEPDQESPIRVPLKLRVDGTDAVRRDFDFADDTAGDAEWYLYRGFWRLHEGALIHDVYSEGQGVTASDRIPRAFLGGERFFADGYRLEADVRLSALPLPGDEVGEKKAKRLSKLRAKVAGEESPTAKLYLYRNKKHFLALTVTLGEEGGYTASWNLGDGARYGAFTGGAGMSEPQWDREVRLALWVRHQRIHASVDGYEVGSAEIGQLGLDNWGKAGLGCEHAVCIFDDVSVQGQVRPPPGDADAEPADMAEPVEP